MSKNIFQDTALYLAVATGSLYFLGRINYSVYLQKLGLSSSLFPKETTDYIVMAFSKYFVIASIGLFLISSLPSILILVWRVIFSIITLLTKRISYKTYKNIISIREYIIFEWKLIPHSNIQNRNVISDAIFIVSAALVTFVGITMIYIWQGNQRAEATLKELQENPAYLYTIVKDNETINFSIVTCSSITKLCAIYVHGDNQMAILNLDKLDGAKIIKTNENGITTKLSK